MLRPGALISPNLRLVRELGRGGMARVWVADHLTLRTQVAVKFLAADLVEDEHTRARFFREASASAQVKSPHVVQVLDHGVAPDGTPFIVMELLEGRDLAEVIAKRKRLTVREVAAIVRQIAHALTKAHALGIVHRDIKPENVFLCDTSDDGGFGDGEPMVKLLDFGIAKGGTHLAKTDLAATQSGMLIGTPEYMSPEQLFGGEIDAAVDLWSLAVVAFYALTGTLPFEGQSMGALGLAVHRGPTVRPSDLEPTIPDAIDDWFFRACAREKSARFPSARALSEALHLAAGEAIEPLGTIGMRRALAGALTPSAMSILQRPVVEEKPRSSSRGIAMIAAALTIAVVSMFVTVLAGRMIDADAGARSLGATRSVLEHDVTIAKVPVEAKSSTENELATPTPSASIVVPPAKSTKPPVATKNAPKSKPLRSW